MDTKLTDWDSVDGWSDDDCQSLFQQHIYTVLMLNEWHTRSVGNIERCLGQTQSLLFEQLN